MSDRGPQPPEPGQPEDRWADVVAAAGYDESADAPIYTGGRRDLSALPEIRRMQERLLADDAGPAARAIEPHPEDQPSPAPAGWDEAWDGDDDVVLRAFEAHALSEPVQTPRPAPATASHRGEDRAAIDELLGAGADDLVEEAMASPVEGSRLGGRESRDPQPWDDPVSAEAPVAPDEEGWDPPVRVDPYDDDADIPLVPPVFPVATEEPVEPAGVVLRSRRPRGRTVARELVETLLLALLVFLAVRASFQNFKVDGSSMYPTLENGEFLIVNKLVYSEVDVEKLGKFLPFLDAGDSPKRFVFHGPERGDIVVLRDPGQPEVDLIKRVVGLPGETIEIVNGTIFIDGRMLEEPYIGQAWHYTGPRIVIGPGEYFVMGDNRDNSKDSRSVGPIPKDLIIGKALLTYWPARDFGLAPNESPRLSDKTIEAYREEMGIEAVATP
jgi:signal peptidase I